MEKKRTGARKISEIPKSILAELNAGKIESATIVEWFAIDQKILLKNFLVSIKKENYLEEIIKNLKELKKTTVTSITFTIGNSLRIISENKKDENLFNDLKKAKSDSIRNWACHFISEKNFPFKKKLDLILVFADDDHFGVRELAWLSLRPSFVNELEEGLKLLEKLSKSKKENLRRFASEISRPKGVWCKTIQEFKTNPELAIPILENLKSDSSKYVRDSVGNWLNDAYKFKPNFVLDLCKKWEKESKTEETEYILKKALRSKK